MLDTDKIRTLYNSAGMNQRDAAAAMKISQQFLSDILNGRKEPSLRVLSRISSFFGVPVSDLFLESTESAFERDGMRMEKVSINKNDKSIKLTVVTKPESSEEVENLLMDAMCEMVDRLKQPTDGAKMTSEIPGTV